MADPILGAIAERARHAITRAKVQRKRLPMGPYTAVELLALQGLVDIERAATEATRHTKGHYHE